MPKTIKYQQVKDLPPYVKNPVKALSRHLFGVLTNTDIDKVQVLANVKNKGPNSETELGAAYKWLRMSGRQDHALIKDLQHHIHGLKLYNTEGITHLVVHNNAGVFIFSWPSLDNKITETSK